MRLQQKQGKLAFVVLVIISVLMLLLVIRLMGYVQSLLISDLRISLTEIASQNKDAIASRLQLRFQAVDTAARQFAGSIRQAVPGLDRVEVRKYIARIGSEFNDGTQFIADDQGVITFQGGRTINIAGRKYFRESVAGRSNISDQLISRYDGDNIFVISAPIHIDGMLAGAFQDALPYEEVRKTLAAPMFSSSGYAHIIDRDGYLIVGNGPHFENYFRDLYAMGNPQAAKFLEQDIRAGRSGFVTTSRNDNLVFSAYTPIDRMKGWYLVVSVPVAAVFPNGRMVVSLFYAILFLVVFFSAAAAGYFLWYKKRQQDHLRTIAFVDSVTGGDTYAKFVDEARQWLQRHPPGTCTIAKVDIDNFKYINKFFGFEAGNQVLRNIHACFSQRLGYGERVARITGDNFVMLLNEPTRERLDMLITPQVYKDMTIYPSAGLYTVNDPGEDLNIMVDKAGVASRRIKGLVHELYAYYTQEMEVASFHNETLKHRIRLALQQSEFIPFYQPKVDIQSNRVIGCEALARWRMEDGTFVSPAEFIPISEQTGMVVDLDMMIYEKALMQLRSSLDAHGLCVPISVNFSKMHLYDLDFPEKLVEMAGKYAVSPAWIEVELTESAFFDGHSRMADLISRLRRKGFRVAMDDFGSGYSSLNMLKNLPIDVLKIDRQFLEHSSDEFRRDVIFSGVVGMAGKLGLAVVAEGVETPEDVELMRQCGCRIAQGYYYSRPLPEDAFTAFLLERGVDLSVVPA